MTREGKWPLAVVVVVVLATVLLSACGSSDSDSSSSGEAASTSSTTAAQNDSSGGARKEQSQSGSASKPKDQGQDSSSRGAQQGGGNHSENTVAPLEVSGGGSAQFRTKGGDNSIQEFGEESESELQEVAEIVHGFYVSRSEEKWDVACSYLAKPNVEQLVELVSQSPEFKGAGCSEALQAFTRPLPPALEREITTVDAGSFRREDEQGFLIYYGPDRTVYSMPMREEDGTWKVAALSASALG